MRWQDKGFLLSINKYNENSAVAEFLTEYHGKTSGVIFGATSKKIKNYLLIGNKFHLNFSSKYDGKVGYFKIEIDKILTPYFLENKMKLYCIIYAMNLIKIITVESQENKNIFSLIEDFFLFLQNENWLLNFIFWELKIYKNIGYDINFKNYVKNKMSNGVDVFFVESTNKIVPSFLINQKFLPKNQNDIIEGFKIVGDYLEKTIIKPNNLKFPISRVEFLNLIKSI